MAKLSGLALISLEFKKRESIAIISQNRPEWIFEDLGCTCVGGVTVGVYPTSSMAELEYIVNHSAARVLFVEDEEQLDKALGCLDNLRGLNRIVLYDQKGLEDFEHAMVLKFDEFIQLGQQEEKKNGNLFEQRIEESQPDDIAVLVYTSGTTGPPKGAMLSYRNIIWTNKRFFEANPISEAEDHLSCFPLCHVLERFWTVYHPIYHGYVCHFPENLDAIPQHLMEVQPTIMFAVPRYWEKFYSSIQARVDDALAIERWVYNKAMRIGSKVATLTRDRRPVPLMIRLLHALADWFVCGNIKRMLGLGRARLVFSGGAPISPDLLLFFHALGLQIRECYGSTEASAVSAHQGADITPGTVGKLFLDVEVRIADDGEILVKGPNVFVGYLKEPELTATSIVNGWYHTGDVGEFDENGDLKITDRKKDIIITAGGKNITPSEIENQLKFSPYINDAVIVGDGRRYLTSLIMIDEENVIKYAQDHRVPFTTYASLTEASDIIKLIQKQVDSVNTGLARVETIKKFRLLNMKLTPEDQEVTPTLKLKRKLINDRFKDLIDTMY
jgi:long-chain acyl-CoA synthetase